MARLTDMCCGNWKICPGTLHTNSLYYYCHCSEIVLSLLLPEQDEIVQHQMQLKFNSGELNSLLVRIANLRFEATVRNVIGKVINSSKEIKRLVGM